MDNGEYETYSYLPEPENPNVEQDQFLIVQDDGSYLVNRPVQYVTQVPEQKDPLDIENIQSCTVFDVSQQYFVDVDNTSELISVPDQYVLPDADNNIYSNSYLLQPLPPETQMVMEQDVVEQYAEAAETVSQIAMDLPPNGKLTEVTLTDDQYHTLEQKGWILLETSEKIFVLDMTGLHDITGNESMIEKLKNEAQNNYAMETDASAAQMQTQNIYEDIKYDSDFANDQEAVEFIVENDIVSQDNDMEQLPLFVNAAEEELKATITEDQTYEAPPTPVKSPSEASSAENEAESSEESEEEQPQEHEVKNVIKIKTDLVFKDIPERMVLGKTPYGKQLVAKVIRHEKKIVDKYVDSDSKPALVGDLPGEALSGLPGGKLDMIIERALADSDLTKLNEDYMSSAENVIGQLIKSNTFKHAIINRNLLVTKSQVTKDLEESGKVVISAVPTLMTGRVAMSEHETWRFIHEPELMKKMRTIAEKATKSTNRKDNISRETDFLHIHITEVKHLGDTQRISISLTQRSLTSCPERKKNTPGHIYACGSCAALFLSQKALKEHQEAKSCAPKVEEPIAEPTQAIIIDDGVTKMYACIQCKTNFPDAHQYNKHVKVHMDPTQTPGDSQKKSSNMFKCQMCPSIYFHSSTLTKHIVTKHIKAKTNLIKPFVYFCVLF